MAVDFGIDLDCLDDLTEGMREISGPLVVAQDCYRRLITPRGKLLGEPDFGLDLAGYLSKGMTPERILAIPGEVERELLKDERLESVEVTSSGVVNGTLFLAIRGMTGAGPFKLGVDATPAAVNLLGITV